MPAATPSPLVADVRRFNRFYTQQIGALQEVIIDSPFSLTEARVLYELAHRGGVSAADLAKELGLDPGYLSRIVRRFTQQGLLARAPSPTDGRQSILTLTAKGKRSFARIDARSDDHMGELLARLSPADQARAVGAMRTLQSLFGGAAEPEKGAPAYILRDPRPGDLGWVVQRHGAIYAQEQGWQDPRFEALVAGVVSEYVKNFDPRRERCWIAERDGAPVGSVFLTRKSNSVGKLRLLLLEPSARGLGIGRRLVGECVRHAREVGYRTLSLWTHGVLHTARHLYKEAGFVMVAEDRHDLFGQDLTGETWELKL